MAANTHHRFPTKFIRWQSPVVDKVVAFCVRKYLASTCHFSCQYLHDVIGGELVVAMLVRSVAAVTAVIMFADGCSSNAWLFHKPNTGLGHEGPSRSRLDPGEGHEAEGGFFWRKACLHGRQGTDRGRPGLRASWKIPQGFPGSSTSYEIPRFPRKPWGLQGTLGEPLMRSKAFEISKVQLCGRL